MDFLSENEQRDNRKTAGVLMEEEKEEEKQHHPEDADAEIEFVGTVNSVQQSQPTQKHFNRSRRGSSPLYRQRSSGDRQHGDRDNFGRQASRSHTRWDRHVSNNNLDKRPYPSHRSYYTAEFEDNNSSSSLDRLETTQYDAIASLPASTGLGRPNLQQMQHLEDAQPMQSSQQWGMMYPMVPVNGDPGMIRPMLMPTPLAFNQFGFLGGTDAGLAPMAGGCGDPNMVSMVPRVPLKEIIHCKSCTLFPPPPGIQDTPFGEKPPGCRTVFVGGLPESANEDTVHEIFERCGEITIVRMSRKNFCHIRFEDELCVDSAIFLSGYRVRIGSNVDDANTGRLFVDYAQARDDFYEWECRQRQLQREQRHRERIERESMRPPSPPPITHYTEHEASVLSDRLKAIPNMCDEGEGAQESIGIVNPNFYKAVQTLTSWLERGDCTKRNVLQFYNMIQSTNSHIRRLAGEKSQVEEEMHRAKQMLREQVNGILIQFNLIEKVFMAASHQKVWDHFTKAQRKSIDMWKKQAQAIKDVHLQDALNERVEDEMDVSDDDGDEPSTSKKSKGNTDEARLAAASLEYKLNSLQEENDSMRCQIEAYKNEVELLKIENRQEGDEKDKQTRSLQQALQGMQQQLIQVNQQRKNDEEQLNELKKSLGKETSSICKKEATSLSVATTPQPTDVPVQLKISEGEAKLIGLLATFLTVHPFGAGIDYIWSYLQRMNSSLQPSDVETMLLKFPTVFRQELCGIGAKLERKWRFTGFET